MTDTIFIIIYLVALIVGSMIRKVYVRRPKKKDLTDDRKIKSDSVMLAIVSIGMFFIPFIYILTDWLNFADYSPPFRLGWLGAIIFAFALYLLWRGHVDLGRNFSPAPQIQKGQTLVTSGAYKYVRHPLYAAHILWAVAQVLLLHNWIAGFSFLVVSIPFYMFRVSHEEKMMLDNFGDEYRKYMKRTGGVIPRLKR